MTGRPTVGQTVQDCLVMAQRDLRATVRKPILVVFAFVQPVMFLVLFRYVFGGAIETGEDYVDFLLPGILLQSAIFGALFTGVGLAEDLRAGVVDRLRSLPMARSAVLVGRTVSDLVRNAMTLAVMGLTGLAVGWRPDESVPEVLAAFALVLGFAYCFSWIAASIAMAVRDPETAQSAGFIWAFPLTFASSAFVPAGSMPAAVEAFADVNPVTLCTDAVRALTIGGDAFPDVWWSLLWIAGLLAVFVPLSVRLYRRLD